MSLARLHASVRRAAPVVALAIAAALTAALTGCGTKTSTTHLWQAQATEVQPAALRHIIVFGGAMGETQRRSFEDRLASRLSEYGVSATPSYQIFPELPDTERARAEVQRRGYDGALVSTLRSVRERQTYVPGYYQGGGFWGGYYGSGWGIGYSPGYIVTDEIVGIETSLWDLRSDGGALVWSAMTKTTNPSSGRDLTDSLAREIVPNIADAGLISRKP